MNQNKHPHIKLLSQTRTLPRVVNTPALTAIQKSPTLGLIDLSHATPIAAGSERLIFTHPSDPSLLVKVINQSERCADLEAHRLKRWRKKMQRDGIFRVYRSELTEYVCAVSQAGTGARPLPLGRIVGLAQTTMGLGMIVEKIRAPGSDDMAPTLQDIVLKEGLSTEIEARLDQFFADLADCHVIVNDPSPRNIVFGVNAQGVSGVFLVDGFGQKQMVPLLEWSKSLNRRRVIRKYDVMLTKLRRKTAMRLAAAQAEESQPVAPKSLPH